MEIQMDNLLFSPMSISKKSFKNRIVCAPHWTSFNTSALYSDRYVEYLAARAAGGAGWVVTEPMGTTQNSRAEIVEGLRGWEPGVVSNWKSLTERIHSYGSKISLTIGHAGRNASWSETGLPAWAPSPDPSVITREIPKEMSKEEIALLSNRIRLIAKNALESNFDAIEIQVTADYLFGSFLSPLTNYRSDEYGGSLQNRMRALQESLHLVRQEVGKEILIGFRISADHMVAGGLSKEESAEVIGILKDQGVLDFVSVIVGSYYSLSAITPAMGGPIGLAVSSASFIRSKVDIPVVVAGRIPTPANAEEILKNQDADFIAFARPFIADPNWPKKVLEGKEATIYPCLYCNQQCVTRLSQKLPLSCVQNPSAGKEKLLEIKNNKSLSERHICVIGAGPAGIEAAISLSSGGLKVTLIEQGSEFGGRLLKAASIPGREEWLNVIKPRINVMKDLDIKIHLSTVADEKLLDEINPDAVVLAVGGKPWKVPQYRGEMNTGVFSTLDDGRFLSLDDLLEEKPENQKIVLVDETGRRSVVAIIDWLLGRGNKITVITTFPYVGYPAMLLSQEWAVARETFKKDGLRVIPFTKVVSISKEDGISLVNVLTSERDSLELCDHVVLALGDESKELEIGSKYKTWEIGDCASPRDIGAALSDGLRVANLVMNHYLEKSD
jgi:2,4-dienoyl-CoA reductase-like NADH-dependent reductase (Old Yellow Enzyme family)